MSVTAYPTVVVADRVALYVGGGLETMVVSHDVTETVPGPFEDSQTTTVELETEEAVVSYGVLGTEIRVFKGLSVLVGAKLMADQAKGLGGLHGAIQWTD